MINAEMTFFWITIFAYVCSFCFGLFGFITGKPKLSRLCIYLLYIGFLCHTATAISRWIAGGHSPVTDTYELNLTGTWFAVAVFIIFNRLGKAQPFILLTLTPVVFLVLGHGYTCRTEAMPMTAAYKSPWLIVHVIFAWLSFGLYLISTGAAIVLLLKNKITSWKPQLNLPDVDSLDITSYRFITMGFINHAIMLISGAIWAKKLWGHYWNWDALETWSLISFLFYAFYLHARSFLKWKTKTAAWMAALGLIIISISFWGVQWFSPSVHPGP
jgi:cytochrome c-type biogenesis protein CcsB